MYVDIPEYLVPKLKQAAKHLNLPLSELVCDALVSYIQDLEDAADSQYLNPHQAVLRTPTYAKSKKDGA